MLRLARLISFVSLVASSLAVLVGSSPSAAAAGAVAVAVLRTEYAANPLGIDVLQPRFRDRKSVV
jgi:hypothetical protein